MPLLNRNFLILGNVASGAAARPFLPRTFNLCLIRLLGIADLIHEVTIESGQGHGRMEALPMGRRNDMARIGRRTSKTIKASGSIA